MITIVGVKGIPLIKKGDDLARIIVEAAARQGIVMRDGDTIVVSHKIVSKAEGNVLNLKDVNPSPVSLRLAKSMAEDPRHVEAILREARGVVKIVERHMILETKHGFVCANAGVDRSNMEGSEWVSLLPKDPDRSARTIREGIKKALGCNVAVIVSDTFGRPWRIGQVNVAIGVAGMIPIKDYRGKGDMFQHILRVTMIAIADELASAAELVMNKSDGVPVAVISGYSYPRGEGSARELVRPREKDLFR